MRSITTTTELPPIIKQSFNHMLLKVDCDIPMLTGKPYSYEKWVRYRKDTIIKTIKFKPRSAQKKHKIKAAGFHRARLEELYKKGHAEHIAEVEKYAFPNIKNRMPARGGQTMRWRKYNKLPKEIDDSSKKY